MPGYRMGPELPQPQAEIFAPMWEHDARTQNGHEHEWECCLVVWRHRRREPEIEEVVRCAVCHCPRCGHSGDEDPCMLRRHHRIAHVYLSGRVEPVGGGA